MGPQRDVCSRTGVSSSGQHSLCKVTHHPPISHCTARSICGAEAPGHPGLSLETNPPPEKSTLPLPLPQHAHSFFPLLRSLGIACSDQGSCVGSVACDLVGVEERELASASEPLGDQSRAQQNRGGEWGCGGGLHQVSGLCCLSRASILMPGAL